MRRWLVDRSTERPDGAALRRRGLPHQLQITIHEAEETSQTNFIPHVQPNFSSLRFLKSIYKKNLLGEMKEDTWLIKYKKK